MKSGKYTRLIEMRKKTPEVESRERKRPYLVKLQDPLSNVVEEVTVVRNRNARALVLCQEALEPLDRLGIQVVGRLIQQEEVRTLEQQLAKGNCEKV